MVEMLSGLPSLYVVVGKELEVESLFLLIFDIMHQLVCSAEEVLGIYSPWGMF